MRVIDRESLARREHLRLYSGMEFPHVNICAQLDITELWIRRGRAGASPTVLLVFILAKAANRVPELRQRIRGEQLVEHEVVHPSITVLGEDDLFGLVTLTYDADFPTFAASMAEILEETQGSTSLKEFPLHLGGGSSRDDLLSITILPWLAFTSFAITRKPPTDCIPVMAYGKVQAAADRFLLPFFINFHHALADGVHVARFVKYIEEESRALAGGLG